MDAIKLSFMGFAMCDASLNVKSIFHLMPNLWCEAPPFLPFIFPSSISFVLVAKP